MRIQDPGIPLLPTQVKQAGALMARAFMQDPFFTFVFPNADRRERILPWLFEKNLRYGLRYGMVFITASLDGIAWWLGPEKPALEWLGILLSGLFLIPLKLSWRELERSLRLSKFAGHLHKESISGRHLYLVALGVEPSRQGRGVAGALLQPVLAFADQEKLVCYLDTNNANNLAFYERFGFCQAGLGQASQAGPHTWGMLRQPA